MLFWIKQERKRAGTFLWARGFPGGSDGKESTCNVGDLGSIPESGRSPGRGHGNPLQYSCLGNPMGRGAWQATVHGVAKNRTWLSGFYSLSGQGGKWHTVRECTCHWLQFSHMATPDGKGVNEGAQEMNFRWARGSLCHNSLPTW